jgi:hypothetical protein
LLYPGVLESHENSSRTNRPLHDAILQLPVEEVLQHDDSYKNSMHVNGSETRNR